MRDDKKDIWFPAKKYGVGWGFPITWQGWLVLLSYIFLLIAGTRIIIFLKFPFGVVIFPVYVLGLSFALIAICRKKGKTLDFRWGDKK